MKLSVPGLPGVSYDTNAESTATTALSTAAGRCAPKPHGYAVQLLPVLWALEVDLREVPPDHPFQYLHPEGAHCLETLLEDERVAVVGRGGDAAIRFVGAVNDEVERGLTRAIGRERPDEEAVTIEIERD
ncbi:hypothetical protein [Natronobiforma cellulositropha]|uniref:hypothetical protein n=1 Tax=Natronobiforma cellulositropha TaxID=1679076 RepID=UPI0021D56D6F|nr:hypothetical protein [Natronobiforma cellulositropha]